jgi:SAM-dependent methyltransferase
MMAELQRRVTGPARPSLIRGDATRAPIRDQAVDAVLGVHVFHLIPDWMSVLAEARRVLVPGGLLITGYDWSAPGAPRERVFGLWRAILAGMGYSGEYPGARDYSDVHASLMAQGASVAERMVGEWTVARTPGQLIESIEHRSWSSTSGVPDTLFLAALADLRRRVQADLGPPDTVFNVTHRFRWQAYRF